MRCELPIDQSRYRYSFTTWSVCWY